MRLLMAASPAEATRIQDALSSHAHLSDVVHLTDWTACLLTLKGGGWDAVLWALPLDVLGNDHGVKSIASAAQDTKVILVADAICDPVADVIRDSPIEVVATSELARLPELLHGTLPGARIPDAVWRNGREERHGISVPSTHLVVPIAEGLAEAQRRVAEERLAESEARFRAAFDNTAGVMLLASLDLRVIQANDAAAHFFGRSKEELVGKHALDDLTHPDDRGMRVAPDDVLRMRGDPPFQIQKRYLHSSGRVLWGDLLVRIVRPSGGRPAYYVVSIQDITAAKEAEQARARLEDELLHAHKMEALGTLAGGIAHDFNNLLAAILGNADLLEFDLVEGREDRAELLESVREIRSVAARGGELVQQILSFSRRRGPQREPIDIAPVVRETIRILKKTLPTTIELRDRVEGGPAVLADAVQIQQVLTNLCGNARHAMDTGGGILTVDVGPVSVDAILARAVSGLVPGPYMRIAVSDTGAGMAEETRARIFEPFFTTKPPGKGTGLGLPVVHGIVLAHDGAIRVQTALGHGTCFEVFLPITPDAVRERHDTAIPLPRGTGERILLLDDEAALRRVLGRLLEELGYVVTSQASSGEALAMFAEDPTAFDLALVDLRMPAPDGCEVCRRLHTIRPNFPVVLMSGYLDALGASSALEVGALGLLQKPISCSTLANAVRCAIDRAYLNPP